MARERYLIDSEEDSIHSNQIVLTDKKEIRKNWWHYHKMIILGVAIVVALVVSFVYSIVSKVNPDYNVALLTATTLPDALMDEMQGYLEQYGEDVNGDGQVFVQLNSYVIGDPIQDTATDANVLQAAMVQFTADASSFDSAIYLHDEKTYEYLQKTSGLEGFFRYNDGSKMPDESTDFENSMLNWADVPALAEFTPKSLESENIDLETVQKILQRYRISFRNPTESIEKSEKKAENFNKSDELFQRLLRNEKVNEDSSNQVSGKDS